MELSLTIGKTGKQDVYDVRIPYHGWSCCLVRAKSIDEARRKYYGLISERIGNTKLTDNTHEGEDGDE